MQVLLASSKENLIDKTPKLSTFINEESTRKIKFKK